MSAGFCPRCPDIRLIGQRVSERFASGDAAGLVTGPGAAPRYLFVRED